MSVSKTTIPPASKRNATVGTILLLCLGATHRLLFKSDNGNIPIQGTPRPALRHLRSLESSSSTTITEGTQRSTDSGNRERFGSCGMVPYGSLVFEEEIDLLDLPLNELMIQLDHPPYVSPPNPDGPVIVDIGVYVHGISDLDPGANTFAMEGYLDLLWCDARMKFNSSSAGRDSHTFLENDAEKEIEEIWWPAVAFVNEVTRRTTENQELIINSDGTIEYREKFFVTLSSNYDMVRFPFDEQILVAEIESFAWNSDILQFHIEDDLVGFSTEFDIPEHSLTEIHEHIETSMEARDRHPFSELIAEFHIVRNPTYYLTKVVIPLTLIVCISWAVFWMESNDLPNRMAISFTGVLTSVAYQFIVSDILPRHIYNTFLDNFVLLSFIIMTLTVVVNIAVNSLVNKGHARNAIMVDKVCQVVFPACFFSSAFILAGAQAVAKDNLSRGGVVGISVVLVLACLCLLAWRVRQYLKKHPSDSIQAGPRLEKSCDDGEVVSSCKQMHKEGPWGSEVG
eukprot:scaffold2638_cov114-Cylindrotheca_fusiformis.AAC.4